MKSKMERDFDLGFGAYSIVCETYEEAEGASKDLNKAWTYVWITVAPEKTEVASISFGKYYVNFTNFIKVPEETQKIFNDTFGKVTTH